MKEYVGASLSVLHLSYYNSNGTPADIQKCQVRGFVIEFQSKLQLNNKILHLMPSPCIVTKTCTSNCKVLESIVKLSFEVVIIDRCEE